MEIKNLGGLDRIGNFDKSHRFLSNFWRCDLEIAGMVFPTAEHAYQALKTESLEEREAIRLLSTPGKAKRAGRQVTLRSDWKLVRIVSMKSVLWKKFRWNSELRERLIATGDIQLVEGNVWHDNYWGNCTCDKCDGIRGKNWLGRLLMQVREKLAAIE